MSAHPMRTQRQSLGLTQDVLAGRARMATSTVARIEGYRETPRQPTKRRLLKTLHVPFAQAREMFPPKPEAR